VQTGVGFDMRALASDRKSLDNLMSEMYPVSDDVEVVAETIKGTDCYWFTPKDVQNNRLIVYLHGGAYVQGSCKSHQGLVSDIALLTGSKILFVEYSLAPEHPYPTAVNEVIDIYGWLLSEDAGNRRVEANQIIMMGDSAGGGLIISSQLNLKDEKATLPALNILLSPWVDLTCASDSWNRLIGSDKILTENGKGLKEAADMYRGSYATNYPSISSVYADLTGLPTALIQIGTQDSLLDDSITLADKLDLTGVNTRLEVYPNQPHVWHLTHAILAEDIDKCIDQAYINQVKSQAKEALNNIVSFIKDHFNEP
jgi:acetyl esterase/lipase